MGMIWLPGSLPQLCNGRRGVVTGNSQPVHKRFSSHVQGVRHISEIDGWMRLQVVD